MQPTTRYEAPISGPARTGRRKGIFRTKLVSPPMRDGGGGTNNYRAAPAFLSSCAHIRMARSVVIPRLIFPRLTKSHILLNTYSKYSNGLSLYVSCLGLVYYSPISKIHRDGVAGVITNRVLNLLNE